MSDGQILPIPPSVLASGPPPAGARSNFLHPFFNGAPNLIACNVILLVVSTLVVGARIASRTLLTDWRLGWDDYTIILAFIGTAIFGSFIIETTHFGLGKHIWDVPMTTYTPHYLWWIMATFAACPASYYFVKLSILLFYLRVFQLQARLRYIIYALIAYCTIYYWVAFATILGLCNARNREWDITMTMNCFAYGKLIFAIGGLDLVADAIILAFPIPMVLKLRISWAQKIYLLFVFLAGLVASLACVIRVALAVQYRGTTDATYAQYRIVTLFCIEHYLALIAACMPTLGPFFKHLRPNSWKHVVIDPSPPQSPIRYNNAADPAEAFEQQRRSGSRGWQKPRATSKSLVTDESLLTTASSVGGRRDEEMGKGQWGEYGYGMQPLRAFQQQQGRDQTSREWKDVAVAVGGDDGDDKTKRTLRNEMELKETRRERA